MKEQPRVCKTKNEIEAYYNKNCTIEGIYSLESVMTKGCRGLIALWPVIVLEGGGSVLIDSFWDKSKVVNKRSKDEKQDFIGKKVRVAGRLNPCPPGAIQNMGFPCICPIESLSIVKPINED